jgi:hypothetical protein
MSGNSLHASLISLRLHLNLLPKSIRIPTRQRLFIQLEVSIRLVLYFPTERQLFAQIGMEKLLAACTDSITHSRHFHM